MRTYKLEKIPKRLNCYDCGCEIGSRHGPSCDVERCSACGMQKLSCSCGGRHDPDASRWTGYWPGELEAARAGLFAKFKPYGNPSWVETDENDPEGRPNLSDWILTQIPKVILV